MKKGNQIKPYIRLVVSLLLFFSLIFTGMISESHADASGVWEATATTPLGPLSFMDVLYEEADVLYVPATVLCPETAVIVALNRETSGNTFSLSSPVSCLYEGYTLTADVFSLTFPNDNEFTGTFSGTALGFHFSGSVQGDRVQVSSQLSLNVPVTGLSGSEGSYQAFYIDVPENASGLTITTSGGSGDGDLYLIYSKLPFWFYMSDEIDTNDESVSVVSPDHGIWYVILKGYEFSEGFEGVTLLYTADASPDIVIPVPTGQQIIPYAPISSPELNTDPSQAKPIGIGPLAVDGEMINVQIGLNQTSAPVDIYGAYIMESDPLVVYVLNPDGSFSSFTLSQIENTLATGTPIAGIQPWMPNTVGPVNVDLLNIPTSFLPSGGYSAFLFVTQAGVLNNYYLWTTAFVIP